MLPNITLVIVMLSLIHFPCKDDFINVLPSIFCYIILTIVSYILPVFYKIMHFNILKGLILVTYAFQYFKGILTQKIYSCALALSVCVRQQWNKRNLRILRTKQNCNVCKFTAYVFTQATSTFIYVRYILQWLFHCVQKPYPISQKKSKF